MRRCMFLALVLFPVVALLLRGCTCQGSNLRIVNPHGLHVDRVAIWREMQQARMAARRFGARHGLQFQRQGLPSTVAVFRSPADMADYMGWPSRSYGLRVVARVDLDVGVVYLGRPGNMEDLRVELGKWFFYPASYRWGVDRDRDIELRELVERFAKEER